MNLSVSDTLEHMKGRKLVRRGNGMSGREVAIKREVYLCLIKYQLIQFVLETSC